LTALTVYFANAASSTLSTADQLYTVAGVPPTTQSYTTIGNNVTGWGEIDPQGASSWAASGSIGTPTGNGFLYDVTALEGKQIAAGNWTPTIRLNASQGSGAPQAGTLTGTITIRGYVRSSTGVYTAIFSSTLTSQTLTATFATYSLPATAASAVNFGTGDKLYHDIWFNCTGNTNANASQGIRLNRLSTDTSGQTGDPNAAVVTPGSNATGTTILITNVGYNLLRDGMSGAQNPLISYVALGSSSTTPTAGDTQLNAETFRKKVTSYTNGVTGEVLINMYLAPTDDVGANIQEVGFYGGNATSAANSGTLLAHGLYSHPSKLNTESIQFLLDFTI
jgi:hypothetical protein